MLLWLETNGIYIAGFKNISFNKILTNFIILLVNRALLITFLLISIVDDYIDNKFIIIKYNFIIKYNIIFKYNFNFLLYYIHEIIKNL